MTQVLHFTCVHFSCLGLVRKLTHPKVYRGMTADTKNRIFEPEQLDLREMKESTLSNSRRK